MIAFFSAVSTVFRQSGAILPVAGPLGLLMAYLLLCVAGRRLHDMGLTAWILAAPAALIAVPVLLAPGVQTTDWLIDLTRLGVLLWLGLATGTSGANRFGPTRYAVLSSEIAAGPKSED